MKKEEEIKKQTGIVRSGISEIMKKSFIEYSMSVITSRALPDIRDGLKPVHRRILYAMRGMGLTANSKFRKSAAVVGEVLGKYHPHGDSSVYEAMVNMAQDFSYRYPLVIGQGNFGSLDGDSAAAQRYTEAKMSKISEDLLRDIEKDTVDFMPNYDGTQKEPVVLPTRLPNLLLNGVLGIAVGMATNIPPHNLNEVVDATNHLIQNPKATNEDLLEFIKGPDFPLGGMIFNKKDIQHAYSTGRGGVVCRGEAEITEFKAGRFMIVISSLPFRVNRANLVIKIANLVRDKKLKGVKDLRDESSDTTRLVVEVKPGENPERILNYIYKHTDLESNFNFNMTALVDGVPQLVSLKDILEEFVKHRQEVVIRRTQYDLKKAEARAHILEGLKKALDQIDAVIQTIRASRTRETAKVNLMKKFKFTEIQTEAILNMRLQKLAGLERKLIEDELKEKQKLIKYFKDLLASPKKILKLISEELEEMKKAHGDERRTRVFIRGTKNIDDEDLIPSKDSALVFTAGGYIKRTDPSEYKAQKRGGIGVSDIDTKEEDAVTTVLVANTHSDLLFFTNQGRVYSLKLYELPEVKRNSRGKSVNNYISLEGDETVTSIIAIPKETKTIENLSLVMVTEEGTIKKVELEAFKNVRRSGLIAINLKDGDKLYGARITKKDESIIIATQNGQSIRFNEDDVRAMGRTAGGVRGINLKKQDKVVGIGVVANEDKDSKLLVVTENGFGKLTDIDEYKIQGRGGSGIRTANLTGKTGKMIGARVITNDDSEIMAISKNGQIIRLKISGISVLGRATQGVRIMKPRSGDSVVSIAVL